MSEELVCQGCGHQRGNHRSGLVHDRPGTRCQLRDCDCADFTEVSVPGTLASKLAVRLVADIGYLQHMSTDRQNLTFARQIQRFIDTHLVELQGHLTERMLLAAPAPEVSDEPRGGVELQAALEKL